MQTNLNKWVWENKLFMVTTDMKKTNIIKNMGFKMQVLLVLLYFKSPCTLV